MIEISRIGSEKKELIFHHVSLLLKELEGEESEFEGIDPEKIYCDMEDMGERYNAFIATAGSGEVVGIMTVMETFAIYAGGNYAVIDEMYVAPNYRSQGIGKKFLTALKEFARQRKWQRIDVTAPPEEKWNRTVAFYEKEGFVFTGPKMRLVLI
jgi:GNAT superfamily N-acetyltransferase